MRVRLDPRWIAAWIGVPLVAGALLALLVPPPGAWGTERESAVLLLDGQAYFGHLRETPWSEEIELHDVYYFQDARATTTGLPLGLVRRGSELHQPTGAMRIRRERILAIEQVGPASSVMTAITTDRSLPHVAR